jgi:acetyltransferase-like isoleucine patch superfamily enzyme
MSSVPYTKDIVEKKYKKNIGKHTYGNVNILDWGEGSKLIIGKYCSIAENVTIFLGGEHRSDWVTTYPFPAIEYWKKARCIKGHPKSKGSVIIGNDVWIGYGSTILSGVKIGDGAIIGAKSLVTKNIDPYTIVGGNPAKIIRKRFDDATINKLLKIKWWNWSEFKINRKINILCSSDLKKMK